MKTPKLLCTIAAIALAQGSLFAVNTDPVGFVSVTVPANSDATIAVPLNRTSEFKGLTSAFSGISGSVTITVAGTPGWTAGQFAPLATANKTYALQLASGTKEGLTLPITNNGTNTVTVTVSASDDLTGVLASGEQIDIMPYWTPSSIFTTSTPVGTQLLGFQAPNAGINVGNSEQYTCSGAGVWEDDINFGQDGSHVPLKFGGAFIIRNNSAAQLAVLFVGGVPMSTHRVRLSTQANNVAQDIAFGFMSPVPEKLSSIGDPSIPSGQQTSNFLQLPAAIGDQILGFDNSTTGINKGNAIQFTWSGTEWEDDINFGSVANYQTTLKPGFGYIYRKAASPTATSVVWSRLPSYLQ
jgi:uncharacterized protein (TIGR02597 family)